MRCLFAALIFPVPERREFRHFWRFSTGFGRLGCRPGETNFPASRELPGLNAAAAPARPARPSRASAPRRRTARPSRPTARPPAASANRLPLNSTIPAAKLHPATVAGPRRGSRPCASAMTATSAAACTMPYSAPVRSNSAALRVRFRDAPRARPPPPRRDRPARRSPAIPASPAAAPRSRSAVSYSASVCAAIRSSANSRSTRRRPARPIARRRSGSRGQRRDRPGQRRDVSRRDEQPGLLARPARPHDLAASRHVAGDDRPPAGRGFEQRFRQSLAIGGRQHRDRGLGPDLAHVLDPAEPARPSPPGSAASAASARSSSESGLSGSVGPASTSSIAEPLGAQQAHRSDRVEHALAAQHAADQRHPDARPARLRDSAPAAARNAPYRPRSRGSGRDATGLSRAAASASRSSGFCTMMRAPPAACRNPRAQRRAGQPRRPARRTENPEPSPLTAAMQAGRSARRGNARRSAAPPNSTGFSAT